MSALDLAGAFASDVAWDPAGFVWDATRLKAMPLQQGGVTSQQGLDGVQPSHWNDAKQSKLPKGPLVCQVEGCGKDLTLEKGYYQRYRVCEQHLKLLSLIVDGKPSRFCQQCGRFHDLSEFDGDKRSCRTRLLQHNARRRKRDPSQPLAKDTHVGKASKSPMLAAPDSSNTSSGPDQDVPTKAATMVATPTAMEAGFDQQAMAWQPQVQVPVQLGMQSNPSSVRSMQDSVGWNTLSGMADPEALLLQSTANGLQSSNTHAGWGMASAGAANQFDTFGSSATAMQMDDMLFESLLGSDAPLSSQMSAPMSGTSTLPTGPLSGWDARGLGSAAHSATSMGGYNGMMIKQEQPSMMQPGVSSLSLQSPMLGSAGPGMANFDLASSLNKKAQQQQQALQQASQAGGMLGYRGVSDQMAMAQQQQQQQPGLNNNSLGGMAVGMGGLGGMAGLPSPAGSAAPSGKSASFDLARRLVAGGGMNAQYQSDNLMVRISIKIANCTPDQLPPDLYMRLRNIVSTADASVVQGFLRPGCTHLVVDVLVPAGEAADAGLTHAAVRSALGDNLLQQHAVLTQLGTSMELHSPGSKKPTPSSSSSSSSASPASTSDCDCASASSASAPVLCYVQPCATLAEDGTVSVLVIGRGITAPGARVFARCQGGYVTVSSATPIAHPNPLVRSLVSALEAETQMEAGSASATTTTTTTSSSVPSSIAAVRPLEPLMAVRVVLAGLPGQGLVAVEVQGAGGCVLSAWKPLAVLAGSAGCAQEAAQAAELNQQAYLRIVKQRRPAAAMDAVVVDFGLMLDAEAREAAAQQAAQLEADAASSRAPSHSVSASGTLPAVAVAVAPANNGNNSSANKSSATAAVTVVHPFEAILTAENLLAWTAAAGLPAVSIRLISYLVSHGQTLANIMEAPYADGACLLHKAVISNSAEMVRALQRCAELAGAAATLNWEGAVMRPSGLTPLQIAEAACSPEVVSALRAITVAREERAAAAAAAAAGAATAGADGVVYVATTTTMTVSSGKATANANAADKLACDSMRLSDSSPCLNYAAMQSFALLWCVLFAASIASLFANRGLLLAVI